MGAATADAIFALIAGFGVNYVVQLVKHEEFIFELIGSIVVVLMGLKIYFTNTVKQFRVSKNIKGSRFTRN